MLSSRSSSSSSSRSVLQKCSSRKIDAFDGLRDDILVVILSSLTLTEAASTSILARRWRYLWTFITGSFDFDARNALCTAYLRGGEDRVEIEKIKYLDWVNHVLKLHQGHKINYFRICCHLDLSYTNEIDRWIKFAIEKRVERLELDLSSYLFSYHPCNHVYSFPGVDKLLSWSNATKTLSLLKSLRLVCVNVTQKFVNHILCTCTSLEELTIIGAVLLFKLEVVGPSLKLKYLELHHCGPLEDLEISANYLKSLVYYGQKKKKAHFENVPLLSDLSIGGPYCKSFIFETHRHSSYLSQLVKLKLNVPPMVIEDTNLLPLEYPTLCNVKELELRFRQEYGNPLFCFTALIKACPSLTRFAVQFVYSEEDKRFVNPERAEEQRLAVPPFWTSYLHWSYPLQGPEYFSSFLR